MHMQQLIETTQNCWGVAATSARPLAAQLAAGQVPFTHCTAYKTRQLARRVTAHFEKSIASLELKGTQFSLLGFVVRDGPLKPADLARNMELSASTLSRNLQPLIQRGLIAMNPGPDARTRSLTATPQGKAVFETAGVLWMQAQASLSASVGATQLANAHLIIDAALNSWSQSGA
jgi:DNA-binding MarR family transcriptional regulator